MSTTQSTPTTQTVSQSTLDQAVDLYMSRRDRRSHPDGKFDSAGRWYPSESESRDCCAAIRSPSRAYPYSYMVHCRTMPHVAALCGVDLCDLRAAVRVRAAFAVAA